MLEKLIPNPIGIYYSDHKQQSDLATKMGYEPDMQSEKLGLSSMNHKVCALNQYGYIPIISTVSGAYRTLVGLALLIKSFVCLIFDSDRAQHVEGLKIAAASIGRGLIEMIPVIGNIIAINIDASRMMHRWAEQDHPYADASTIPLVRAINSPSCIAAIPVIGSIVGVARTIFAFGHLLVNLPPALCGNNNACQAMGFSLAHIGLGLLEIIPIVGTVVNIQKGLLNPYGDKYDYDY